jgi:secondary thiamine-phosphate synthase enzyme
LKEWGVREGMCFLFLQHTSASLVISENWDPTARADLETFMERLIPEGDEWYTHDLEGSDDATSHIRAMLTDTSLTIPIDDGNLSLGTWQGIYIFEHRTRPHVRKVLIRALGVE